MDTPKYGFKVNQTVLNKVLLFDENGNRVPPNSKLRIVAITPKVWRTTPHDIRHAPQHKDSREYFYNAVRAEQESDHGNRIRANFVTIKKIS